MKLPEDINTPEGRKKWLKGKKIMFGCCFCNKGMPKPEVAIIIEKNGQNYWAHRECLKNKLCKEARVELQ